MHREFVPYPRGQPGETLELVFQSVNLLLDVRHRQNSPPSSTHSSRRAGVLACEEDSSCQRPAILTEVFLLPTLKVVWFSKRATSLFHQGPRWLVHTK